MKLIFLTTCFIFVCLLSNAQQNSLSLAGEWKVRLDSLDKGLSVGWQNEKTPIGTRITLPGTLDEAGLGNKSLLSAQLIRPIVDQLTRKHSYIGAAWYSREVTVPEQWKGTSLFLFLERALWKTEVWVDGKKNEGTNESLVTPHVFDLTALLTPGKHVLTIRVDNRKQHDISLGERNFAHAYTDGTQVIWNGVLGKIRLESRPQVTIKTIHIYPDLDGSRFRLELGIVNPSGIQSKGDLEVSVPSLLETAVRTVALTGTEQKISLVYNVDAGKVVAWDEFNPFVYQAKINLKTTIQSKAMEDTGSTTFGFRKLETKNSYLYINNRRLFLRGTLECAIFPLTGYPPMDEKGWEKILATAKSHGLNHLRFHSWCPPEAAFQAADKLGFYLQVELPLWSLTVGKDESVNTFLKEEADRIISNYGNHPSFCFWSIGNELQGDFNWINQLVRNLKQKDPRHLYTATTFTFQKGHGRSPEPNDEFFITQYTKKGWIRGQGIFNAEPPNFSKDYSKAIDSISVPIIAHEIGQYAVYPNMDEIKKYTGVLDPLNLKAVQEDLKQKGMLKLAGEFTEASGKFAVQLYKEEIERALKTNGFSGFQLLDLHDFPGQGTALVGVLDAFWQSKGFVTDEEFRKFCSPVVPLVRYPKAVFTNDETFEADVEVANFGVQPLKGQLLQWKISTEDGKEITSGSFAAQDFRIGNGLQAGTIKAGLGKIQSAAKVTIDVQLSGTPYKNNWSIWVYPANLIEAEGEVFVTQSLQQATEALEKGRKVLLCPKPETLKGIQGKFVPVFWSPVHFPDQPGTMGLLIKSKHKALHNFPSDTYSNWQWWDLAIKSKALAMADLPDNANLVRPIDNFFRNQNLTSLFEAKMGKGQLIFCSIDITTDLEKRPQARQLRYSLLKFMNSAEFKPEAFVGKEQLQKLFQN
jgi:Glycosyl hydrolases family 2, sugar binding domain/Glycosyl hydrolases family 2, TIM barrel domain